MSKHIQAKTISRSHSCTRRNRTSEQPNNNQARPRNHPITHSRIHAMLLSRSHAITQTHITHTHTQAPVRVIVVGGFSLNRPTTQVHRVTQKRRMEVWESAIIHRASCILIDASGFWSCPKTDLQLEESTRQRLFSLRKRKGQQSMEIWRSGEAGILLRPFAATPPGPAGGFSADFANPPPPPAGALALVEPRPGAQGQMGVLW